MENFDRERSSDELVEKQEEQIAVSDNEQIDLNEVTPNVESAECENEIISEEEANTVRTEYKLEEKTEASTAETPFDRNPTIKKKHRVLILCFAALGILVVIGALLFGLSASQKKKSDNIIHMLQSNDVNTAFELFDGAGDTVIKRYGDSIEDAFTEMVFDNKYSFGSASTGLVLEDQLDDYSDYLRFSEKAGYSENNKAVRYLKTVLKLKEYVKYNSVISLCLKITDDYENFIYYFKAAMNSSGTTLLTYHNKGKDCIASIYNAANNYSGYLCLDLKSAAREIYMWFDTTGNGVSAETFIKDRDTIDNIFSETADAVGEINDIKKALEAY